jgi:hypothetical protein
LSSYLLVSSISSSTKIAVCLHTHTIYLWFCLVRCFFDLSSDKPFDSWLYLLRPWYHGFACCIATSPRFLYSMLGIPTWLPPRCVGSANKILRHTFTFLWAALSSSTSGSQFSRDMLCQISSSSQTKSGIWSLLLSQ